MLDTSIITIVIYYIIKFNNNIKIAVNSNILIFHVEISGSIKISVHLFPSMEWPDRFLVCYYFCFSSKRLDCMCRKYTTKKRTAHF